MPRVPIEGSRFLVTGGSGFVGSHVVDQLVAGGAEEVVVFDQAVRDANLEEARAGENVRTIEGDVTDRGALEQAAQGVDGVFHLAVLPIGPSEAEPRLALDVNVVGTFNVLDAARPVGARRSSSRRRRRSTATRTRRWTSRYPLDACSMYGASKIAGEYFLRAFCGSTGSTSSSCAT